MKKLFAILSFLKSYKRDVAINLLFNLLYVVFNLLALLIFIPFLNLLFVDDAAQSVAALPDFELSKAYFNDYFSYHMGQQVVEHGPLGALRFICIAVIFLFLFKNLFRYIAQTAIARIRQSIGRDIRKTLYDKVIALPLSFFSEEKKGDILARNTVDVTEIDSSVIGSLEMVFRDPLSIILSFGAMILISPKLTLFSLILMPVSALVIGGITKSLKRTSRQGQEKQGELISYLEETLSGLRIVKAFNAEGAMRKGFSELNERYRKLSIRLLNKRDLASPVSEFLGAGVMVGVVWYGGRLILLGDSDTLTGSEFLGFIIIFSQSLRPIQGIAKTVSNIQKGMASVERINVILDADVKLAEPSKPVTLNGLQTALRFENVHFSYDTQPVLQGIDFTLSKGKTIALVGESGGGKSTIADMIPRFYDPLQGAVTIDGVDLRDALTQDVRALMGVVSQQAILFNDSIRNNITLGHTSSDADIEQAARIAHAHDFIMALPHGYDTTVGDAGGKLSGGQRQRISIARAVLKNPPILILDEATSALDTESERLVQDALEHLMKNRTSIVIAHRLSTIRNADEILVIQQGQIAERGTHDELVASAGVYQRLLEMQG